MYDAIVVGMGAAGCMASAVLQNYDKKVLALEAMERIGGRVHTAPLGTKAVELGAEWIHGTVKNIAHDYAIASKLKLKQQGLMQQVFMSDGMDGDTTLLRELADYAFGLIDNPPTEPEPLGHYITRRVKQYAKEMHLVQERHRVFVGYFLRWMNLIIGNYESCTDWNEVSTQTTFQELDGHLQISWHEYGYKTLFDIILNHHKSEYRTLDLKLNTEVVHIKVPSGVDDPVVVTCKDGAVYFARAVIVTFSVGVLKERHESLFSPPLPLMKVQAINDISIGAVNKIVLLFDEIWWPTTNVSCFAFLWRPQDLATVAEEDKWTTMIFGATLSMANEKCLVIWTSGDEAKMVEDLPDDVVRSKVMALLRKFMGRNLVIPEPIEVLRSNWYSNPFTRGSYSFDNVCNPEHPNARADLAEPIMDEHGNFRLLFAGEATDIIHFSTVHGAVDSGRREAFRLLGLNFENLPYDDEEWPLMNVPNN